MPASSPRPSATTARALLAASGLVLVAGTALAVARPGDLGDDDDPGADDQAVDATPTSALLTSTTAAMGGPSDTVVTVPGSDTTGGTGGTPTSAPGSGLGTDGASVADDATATTGIESMLAPGLGLVAAAALARAAGRRTST